MILARSSIGTPHTGSRNETNLSDSKTRQRWFLWKKWLKSLRQWNLSSGSASFNLRSDSNSRSPVLCMSSLLRMICDQEIENGCVSKSIHKYYSMLEWTNEWVGNATYWHGIFLVVNLQKIPITAIYAWRKSIESVMRPEIPWWQHPFHLWLRPERVQRCWNPQRLVILFLNDNFTIQVMTHSINKI